MHLIINNIKLALNEDIESLKYKTAKKLNININEIQNLRILKESIDARHKNNIQLIYSLSIELENTSKISFTNDLKKIIYPNNESIICGNTLLKERPIIVGSGPSGLFAALLLSEYGFKPIIIERGEQVEKRDQTVYTYWEKGELDIESNVQFGEGGAGTYSDGKLTTRINDFRCERILDEFNKSGIPKEVLYKAKPHVGTDNLKNFLIYIRKKIIDLGGEFRFRSKVTSLIIKDKKIKSIIINENEKLDCQILLLAIGHSARDTFKLIHESGFEIMQKPFSIGLRIEHSQKMINFAQYGLSAGHPKLEHADYQLSHKIGNRCVYTFCMCPGGIVVASASEKGMIVTNGMSEYARDKENSNSAWVVSVAPTDFETSHPLAGAAFQSKLEELAFKLGGRNNSAPIQTLEDFLTGKKSSKLGNIKPSYTGDYNLTDLNLLLPDFIKIPMKESVKYFNAKLNGFYTPDAILTGIETRTSSPVRILRDDTYQANGIKGVYPVGEGSGYAGGIVSAGVDGLKAAEAIIKKYKM